MRVVKVDPRPRDPSTGRLLKRGGIPYEYGTPGRWSIVPRHIGDGPLPVPSELMDLPAARIRAREAFSEGTLTTLRKWGAIGMARHLQVGTETTVLELWLRYSLLPAPDRETPSFFNRYRKIRGKLGVHAVPHPQWVLEAYLRVHGMSALSMTSVVAILGEEAARDAARRLRLMTGTSRKDKVAPMRGTVDDFFAGLPCEAREPLVAHLSREVIPAIAPLDPFHMSRICRIAVPEIRALSAMALIDSTANRRAKGTRKRLLTSSEILAWEMGGVDMADDAAQEAALERIQDNADGRYASHAAMAAVNDWYRMQRAARSLATLVLGERRWRSRRCFRAMSKRPVRSGKG